MRGRILAAALCLTGLLSFAAYGDQWVEIEDGVWEYRLDDGRISQMDLRRTAILSMEAEDGRRMRWSLRRRCQTAIPSSRRRMRTRF